MQSVPLTEAKQILVIRTDHIGDLILSTPFLKALRKSAPAAKITALLPSYTSQVLAGESFVDTIITYPDRDKLTSSFYDELKGLNADIAIALAPRTITYKLAYASGAPCRAGYFYTSRPLTAIMCKMLYLTHSMSFNINKELALGHPIMHEVQQLGELAKAMGMAYEDDSLTLTLSPEEESATNELRRNWKAPVVVLQLHNNWLNLGWTINNLVRLVGGLIMHAQGGEVIITYGAAESKLAADLREALLQAAPSSNTEASRVHLNGNADFRQWACLFNSADYVVTPDTGAVHLAAALKKPVVAVYEPQTATLCTQQWAPWQVPHRSIIKSEDPGASMEKIFRALEQLVQDKAKSEMQHELQQAN